VGVCVGGWVGGWVEAGVDQHKEEEGDVFTLASAQPLLQSGFLPSSDECMTG
jgi:hypothetical protein